MGISPLRVIWCQTSKARIFENREILKLFQQVIRHVSNQLADLEHLLLDQLRPLECLRCELFELHQFGVGQHHSDTVVQVMDPLLDFLFIHNANKFNIASRGFIVSCAASVNLQSRRG